MADWGKMGIRINKDLAREILALAIEWAKSDRPVPDEWVDLTEHIDSAPSKTYTPALGTALLAKATDNRIDPLAIKDIPGNNSYSLRTLGHGVLVPDAVKYGFSLKTTKREPLNNQPFFRYNHMDEVDRIRKDAQPYFEDLKAGLRQLNSYTHEDALAALAAFLRVRFDRIPEQHQFELSEDIDSLPSLIDIVDEFLGEEIDRPRRTQALVAAAFDMLYPDLLTRGLNDPSRNFPGDIQAMSTGKPILSVEVRAKAVPATEVKAFVAELRANHITRAFMTVLHPSHSALPREDLVEWSWNENHVVLTIIESSTELMWAAARWSQKTTDEVLSSFPSRVSERLREIESSAESQDRWRALFA